MGQGLSKRRTVLIVEDDLDLRHLTTTLLEDEQLETTIAAGAWAFRTDAINALACRIRTGEFRPRATQLDLRDNFAGGRRKSGGGDPSRTSCVAPTGGHSQSSPGDGDSRPSDLTEVALAEPRS